MRIDICWCGWKKGWCWIKILHMGQTFETELLSPSEAKEAASALKIASEELAEGR